MGQMHLYVPDEIEKRLKMEAAKRGLSLSKYLQEIVTTTIDRGWPEGYFERVVGSWIGEFPESEDLPPDNRDLEGLFP